MRAGLDFQFRDPERGFDRARVRGVMAKLVRVKDAAASTALEVAAGGKLYQARPQTLFCASTPQSLHPCTLTPCRLSHGTSCRVARQMCYHCMHARQMLWSQANAFEHARHACSKAFLSICIDGISMQLPGAGGGGQRGDGQGAAEQGAAAQPRHHHPAQQGARTPCHTSCTPHAHLDGGFCTTHASICRSRTSSVEPADSRGMQLKR